MLDWTRAAQWCQLHHQSCNPLDPRGKAKAWSTEDNLAKNCGSGNKGHEPQLGYHPETGQRDRGVGGALWLPYTPAAVTSSKEITTQMTLRPPNLHRKETQTAEIWSCLPFIGSGQNHLAMHSERGKLTRQTEEEVGRQH